MGGEVGGEFAGVAGAGLEAAEEAGGSGGIVAGDADHSEGGFVGFEFLAAGIALGDELPDEAGENGLQRTFGGVSAGNELDDLGGEEAVDGMAAEDVGHFVGDDEGGFVAVEIAEIEQGAGDEKEAAGEGEGVGFGVGEAADLEFALLIDECFGEAGGDGGEPFLDFRIGFERRVFDVEGGEVAAHEVFGLDALGFGAGQGAVYPAGFENGGGGAFSETVEKTHGKLEL